MLLSFDRFTNKGFHHADRIDQRDYQTAFGLAKPAHLPPKPLQTLCLFLADKKVNGYDDKTNHADPKIGRKHDDKRHNCVGK